MKLCLLTAAVMTAATGATAQHAAHGGSNVEAGQAQFAAIAEIVTMLRNEPETDWDQVDIAALREHLVDMDNVTTRAAVATTVDDLRVTFAITGDATVAASAQRMVLAHGPMLQQATGWSVMAQATPDGATMRVDSGAAEEMAEVTGLGFFGVMTIGAHHQQHHIMIATGQSPH